MGKVKYSSNNSGGSWWLSDEDWLNLEKAGWKVQWYRNDPHMKQWVDEPDNGRFLGALASNATREGLSLKMAIAEWEDITGESAYDEGCRCCGEPHSFYQVDGDGNMVW
jgi:hypothetical protein